MAFALLLAQALAPFLLTELRQYTGLSPDTSNLISGIINAVTSFQGMLKDPNTNQVTAASLLGAISGAVNVLSTQTKLSPTTLAIVAAFTSAANAGLVAVGALTSVNPDSLKPYTPIGTPDAV